MNERLSSSNRRSVVLTLGSAQTIAWGSSYYLPAVLAAPMARDLGVSPVWVFAAFSLAMIVAAIVGPWSGRRIDLLGGRGLLMATNFVFATGLLAMAASPNVGFLFAFTHNGYYTHRRIRQYASVAAYRPSGCTRGMALGLRRLGGFSLAGRAAVECTAANLIIMRLVSTHVSVGDTH